MEIVWLADRGRAGPICLGMPTNIYNTIIHKSEQEQLQPFAVKMAVAQIFIELGNS